MTAIEWLVVIASGVGGFYLVSRIIDAVRRPKSEVVASARDAAVSPNLSAAVGNTADPIAPTAIYDSIHGSPDFVVSDKDRLAVGEPIVRSEVFRSVSQAPTIGPAKKWNNYIARHWRGELSLPVSYWINGFLGNIAATLAIVAITASTNLKDYFRPELALLSIVSVWITVLVVFVWQMVGVWRSATSYQRIRLKSYWGGIAKFVVIIALLRTIVEFGQTGAPQIAEYYKIYAGDNEVGKYTFRVLGDGQELEFSGGITFGAAQAFRQFVDAMGNLKVVHLDSLGGRISEAQLIGNVIRDRGLSTYVPHRCMSACTIIFLSGRERFISPESRIGFHQPNFPGMTDEVRRDAIAGEERRLRQLGVSAAFAHRANTAAPSDMWFPTTAELLSEHVATQLVNSGN
jgi:hypothetical protein